MRGRAQTGVAQIDLALVGVDPLLGGSLGLQTVAVDGGGDLALLVVGERQLLQQVEHLRVLRFELGIGNFLFRTGIFI